MSHFYASIDQSARKTPATARGHKSTGVSAWCASHRGRIKVRLWHDEKTGEDRFAVEQEAHRGAGICEIIAMGIIGQPAERVQR